MRSSRGSDVGNLRRIDAIIATCAPAWRCGRRRSRPRLGLLGVEQVAVARRRRGVVGNPRPPAPRAASTAFAASPAVPSVPRSDAASAYVSDVNIVEGGIKTASPVSATPLYMKALGAQIQILDELLELRFKEDEGRRRLKGPGRFRLARSFIKCPAA